MFGKETTGLPKDFAYERREMCLRFHRVNMFVHSIYRIQQQLLFMRHYVNKDIQVYIKKKFSHSGELLLFFVRGEGILQEKGSPSSDGYKSSPRRIVRHITLKISIKQRYLMDPLFGNHHLYQ